METKALLKKEENICVATSPSGKHEINIKHGVQYDFMYDSEDNFFIVVDDRIYEETSTAFDFINIEK